MVWKFLRCCVAIDDYKESRFIGIKYLHKLANTSWLSYGMKFDQISLLLKGLCFATKFYISGHAEKKQYFETTDGSALDYKDIVR